DPPDPDIILGTAENDRLVGTSDADTFDGLAGHDRMIGRKGDDVFLGGAGRDTMRGGRGNDTADYSLSDAGISIFFYGSTGFGSGGDAQGDRLHSIETVIGSAFDDEVRGSWSAITAIGQGGDDVLRGSFKGDRLDGGSGADQLTGSLGSDTFVFGDNYGTDTITDFSAGHVSWWWNWNRNDTIELSVTGVDSFTDVLNHASENNGNTVLDFGNNDVLTLKNTRLSQIDESDFSFV
ncbi:MAG: hypothetical protein K0U34_03485, partial [Alphaproteobacteria bacterium]|nr:hypothetical protein [Alphaproteobacteria bacterium]